MSSDTDCGSGAAPTRVRYGVLALIAVAPASAYLTRIIAAFNTTLAAQFHVSNEAIGGLIAGFALGYFLFQVPGGMLAGSLGVRLVLPLLSLAWSLCALWGSAARSAEELYYSRIALGVAQAGLVPCCAKVAADWFPLARRGLVSALMTCTMQLGAIAATGLSALLLSALGWRLLLQVYAATGLVWAAAFFLWFRNRPEQHSATNEAERALIRAGRPPPGFKPASGPSPTPPRSLGRRLRLGLALCFGGSLWAYYLQAFFRAYAYEFFTTWCPAYLEKAHGLGKVEAGALTTWPLLAFGVGSLAGGVVVDGLLTRSGSRRLSRCGSAIAGLSAGAACFAAATQLKDARLVIGILSLGCLLWALSGPATWAAGMDLGGRYTPVVFGLMNMVGNVGAYFCPRHVGQLFDYVQQSGSSWQLVLWLFVGINAAGAGAWAFVNPRRPAVE
jgi:MFS family permease